MKIKNILKTAIFLSVICVTVLTGSMVGNATNEPSYWCDDGNHYNVKIKDIYYDFILKDENNDLNKTNYNVTAVYPNKKTKTLKIPAKVKFNNKKYKVNGISFFAYDYNLPFETIYLPSYATIFQADSVRIKKLKKLYVPKTVEKIELSNMPKLKIIIDKENPYIKMKNGAVYSKNGKVMYTLINNKKIYKISNGTETISFNNELDDTVEKIILPSSAEKITENGFSACVKLKSIKLNNKLKEIGYGAFYKCKSLKRIAIPKKVDKIQPYTFSNCTKLSKVNIKSKIKSFVIQDKAFKNCNNLNEIKISNVSKIEKRAFKGCKNLLVVRLNMEKESPVIEDTAFKNTKNGIKFYVKNQIVADQLKEQLKGSGARNAKILIGKKVVYKNVK